MSPHKNQYGRILAKIYITEFLNVRIQTREAVSVFWRSSNGQLAFDYVAAEKL
jgi:hypothetical protein